MRLNERLDKVRKTDAPAPDHDDLDDRAGEDRSGLNWLGIEAAFIGCLMALAFASLIAGWLG